MAESAKSELPCLAIKNWNSSASRSIRRICFFLIYTKIYWLKIILQFDRCAHCEFKRGCFTTVLCRVLQKGEWVAARETTIGHFTGDALLLHLSAGPPQRRSRSSQCLPFPRDNRTIRHSYSGDNASSNQWLPCRPLSIGLTSNAFINFNFIIFVLFWSFFAKLVKT